MTKGHARSGTTHFRRAAVLLTIVVVNSACGTLQPTEPSAARQGETARLFPLAFTADIDTRTRIVSITPPAMSIAGAPTLRVSGTGG